MNLRYRPTQGYNGLTIVMSNPSRFDVQHKSLLIGNAGEWFRNHCLKRVRMQNCDIRTVNSMSQGLLPNTRVIIALGETASKYLTGRPDLSIHQTRGNLFYHNEIPLITSYLPQDSFDLQNYESRFNPLLKGLEHEDEEKEDKDYIQADKNKSRTRRSNWRFWLEQDSAKALRILANGGKIPSSNHTFYYNIKPQAHEVIHELTTTKDSILFLDIETDSESNMLCFAFNLYKSDTVYCVPVIDHNYSCSYSNIGAILRALAICQYNNLTVTHNGHAFDLIVLACKYRIPIGPNQFDTLLSQHRCFPSVERSLSHVVSQWTYLPYHKDEIVFMPHTYAQEQKNLQYCGKDVSSMRLVYENQIAYAKRIPGLIESFNRGMAQIRPYIIASLTGMRFSQVKRDAIIEENKQLMTQYLRIIHYLVGYPLSPVSPQQCVKYLHEELGYDVVARTELGAPSLKGDAIEQLRLKYSNNPVLALILLYRACAKQAGSLKFKPWLTPLAVGLDQVADEQHTDEQEVDI